MQRRPTQSRAFRRVMKGAQACAAALFAGLLLLASPACSAPESCSLGHRPAAAEPVAAAGRNGAQQSGGRRHLMILAHLHLSARRDGWCSGSQHALITVARTSTHAARLCASAAFLELCCILQHGLMLRTVWARPHRGWPAACTLRLRRPKAGSRRQTARRLGQRGVFRGGAQRLSGRHPDIMWLFMWPWFSAVTCADRQSRLNQLRERKWAAAQALMRVPATCNQMVTCTLSLFV